MSTYLITGGAGFIGSNYVRRLLSSQPDAQVVNLDKLTYAGNPANLAEFDADPRYTFVRGDICDRALVRDLFEQHRPAVVVNFAAESHVDRSIEAPDAFLQTDVIGVHSLLEAARVFAVERFVQISTDEVYGSIENGRFRETDALEPSSPYAASKAGGDRLAHAYFVTYGVPVLVTRASNNYGPYQYPEKLIPLFITNALDDQPLPLYGDGLNVRDWIHVEDHCSGVDAVIASGTPGQVYNIGGGNEWTNVDITRLILELTGKPESLIRPVKDRAGHDRRYALDSSKLQALGWAPRHDFRAGMLATVDWYRTREDWWRPIKSGEFRQFYERQYGRLG